MRAQREYPATLFDFISFLSAKEPVVEGVPTAASYSSPLSSYSKVLKFHAFNDGDQTLTALLKLSLAAHTAAPIIQAKFSYYTDVIVPTMTDHVEDFDASCDVWIVAEDKQLCDWQSVVEFVKSDSFQQRTSSNNLLLPFDNIYTKSSTNQNAILYGDITSPKFLAFHEALIKLADADLISYVFRYKPPSLGSSQKQQHYLSGYGVELAIKTSEYKVIDDRSTAQGNTETNLKDQDYTEENEQIVIEQSAFIFDESDAKMQSIATEDIREIGVKAANVILASESPIDAMIQISQDFPKYSHLIAKRSVTPEQRVEIRKNQRSIIASGGSIFVLNGIELNLKDLNVFSLLTAMRGELNLIRKLQTLNLKTTEAVRLLSLPSSESTSTSDLGWGEAFDVRDDSVIWWNDLEKDSRYERFPRSVKDLLQPSYPGQLKYVAKNMFNALFVLDLTNVEHLNILNNIFHFIENSVPLRFGLIPLVGESNDESCLLAARSFLYIVEKIGRKEAKNFIIALLTEIKTNGNAAISATIETAFETVAAGQFKSFAETNDDASVLVTHKKLLDRIGVDGRTGVFFFNGKYYDVDENWQQNMLGVYPKMLQFLQMRVYEGTVTDADIIYDYFLSKRNAYISISEDHPLKFINLLGQNVDQSALQSLSYVSERENAVISMMVIGDFESIVGLQFAKNALEFSISAPNSRLTFIHNPPHNRISTLQTKTLLPKAAHILMKQNGARNISSILAEKIAEMVESESFNFAAGDNALFSQKIVDELDENAEYERTAKLAKKFIEDIVGIIGGESVIVVNGRIIGPITHPERFTDQDFELLASSEYHDRIEKIDDVLSGMDLNGVVDKNLWVSDACMKISSLAAAAKPIGQHGGTSSGRISFDWGDNFYGITVGNFEEASLRFSVAIDPLSELAQKTSALLKLISKVPGVGIKILLNPVTLLDDLPIKRFYRYVWSDDLNFDNTGQVIAPFAHFKNIPMEPLLTLGLDVPRAWVVRAIDSIYDLDNLKLDNAKTASVDSYFQLRNILVEGHAREIYASTPPRGVQFILGTSPEIPHAVDTITMTNLGYLQLKANPGIWQMRLREGRSREVYRLESVSESYTRLKGAESDESEVVKNGYATVIVDTFEGVTIFPVVAKRVGMENEDVLETVEKKVTSSENLEKKSSVLDALTGFKDRFWKPEAPTSVPSNTTINIFSVASGHLYERFMGIMMLSVMRNTKSPVKFWLIENFLSPKFMNFIPHLAKAYNFEYEFITYNWPHWLRATTRKERTIWAYKILFLDVLFPLNLDKVIFVDADQVVRTDMKELVDLDLQGAVYGYTPMGDSRPEMEGFRFWKTGYWKSHLQGKPYHISALYVIDLKLFRQALAGDRLRQQYQGLSADPNSLANLDQDLPNNMMHEIPIFSLPKEWLWCETWCSDSELKHAKTIDLCNNPLTKEPKLQRAKRIIKEWVELDNLVQAVADKVEVEDKQHDEL
ncbi:hypothetical protein HK100_002475 [Physocladia obscura]|uniref:UDP-glucose:glycoprotein glucosyltransferase n=1 Tax=Physocladia obscura TaxID=109957 RepID=A0AAD5T758_9FUNG|nr:hypothetical protein HK100_002475 [Physocladia obscura]